MIPMIDAVTMAPGAMEAVLSVGPAFLGIMAATIVGAAWLAQRTTEELRRTAARDWDERRRIETDATPHRPLAA
jgi:hypothetical protein